MGFGSDTFRRKVILVWGWKRYQERGSTPGCVGSAVFASCTRVLECRHLYTVCVSLDIPVALLRHLCRTSISTSDQPVHSLLLTALFCLLFLSHCRALRSNPSPVPVLSVPFPLLRAETTGGCSWLRVGRMVWLCMGLASCSGCLEKSPVWGQLVA